MGLPEVFSAAEVEERDNAQAPVARAVARDRVRASWFISEILNRHRVRGKLSKDLEIQKRGRGVQSRFDLLGD